MLYLLVSRRLVNDLLSSPSTIFVNANGCQVGSYFLQHSILDLVTASLIQFLYNSVANMV